MSIIIRLQNLPWSANSVDIRRFFAGLSIPEGGVHIVGGEMGDAFIAFSTDEDARLAMEKNGGKIKDMQIKLLLSSRTEMMRVIEQARQQNMVVAQPHMVAAQPTILTLQQPTRIMTPTSEAERRRGRSPSPRRRSRDRSPARDRRRSPDDRRVSKRDRSRSPSRSSRSFSRDMDRRSDRFKRDDRRYDDSRYRDDRRSARDSPQESKKYLDADHVHSRSQLHDTAGFRDMQPAYDQNPNMVMPGMYPFVSQSQSVKNFTDTYSHTAIDSSLQLPHTECIPTQKPVEMTAMGDQKHPSMPNMYSQEQMSFRSSPFEPPASSAKESSGLSVEQQMSKPRRRTRFEPEFASTSAETRFPDSESNTKTPIAEHQSQSSAYNVGRPPQESYSENRNIWPREVIEKPENNSWSDKRQPLLNAPVSKNGDFLQVVPMDLDPSPSELTPEKEIYQENVPVRGPLPYQRNSASPRNEDPRREAQNRGPILHNDNQGKIPSSLTVEVRGLPPDARIDDILNLFRGIPLPAANIRIEASDQGFEKAYIRFVSVADFEEALNRNRRFVHEGRCELVPCPASAFDDAPRPQKSRPKPKPREEDLTVQLRGLPFSCKDDDVVRFFDGLAILDLYVDVGPDNRATGVGFVEFGSHKDFRAALAMNGKMIGHRYITVSVAGKEMMAVARGEEYNPIIPPNDSRLNVPHSNNNYSPLPNQDRPLQPPNQNRPPINQGRQPPPGNQGRIQPPPGNQGRIQPPPGNQGRMQPPPCISMKGLPENVNNRDIADFLGQVSVMPRAIHIMLRPDKMPSGDAYAELGTPADMNSALEMNGKYMQGNRILVQPISFHEMSEILGRPTPVPPPPAPGVLLRTPNDLERPRRPLLAQGPGDMSYRERPRLEPPSRGGRPLLEHFNNRMEGPRGRPFGPARMRGPRPTRPPFKQEVRFPPPPNDRSIKDFGSPGCVVSINNLHFRAGLEELLDFFRGYNITKDNIIRKYNENGQTTGEARVAFQNPRDAQRAIRELNQKPIMGRSLSLSIL